MAFTQEVIAPQNPRVISLIEGNYDYVPHTQPRQIQFQQAPATLPIIINRDYVPIIAIVGLIGLIGLIALLAYLKR